MAISTGLKYMWVEVYGFHNHTFVWDFNLCGNAFVVEQGQFNFSSNYLKNILSETLPMVLDWAIGNKTCGKVATIPK